MGSKPIYLPHCCRSRNSVNTHIESNTTYLLRQKKNVDVAAPCERTFHLNKFISPSGRTPVGSMSVRTSRNALKSMENLRNGFKSICVWIMADWMLSYQNYEQIRINVCLHPIFQINLSEDRAKFLIFANFTFCAPVLNHEVSAILRLPTLGPSQSGPGFLSVFYDNLVW